MIITYHCWLFPRIISRINSLLHKNVCWHWRVLFVRRYFYSGLTLLRLSLVQTRSFLTDLVRVVHNNPCMVPRYKFSIWFDRARRRRQMIWHSRNVDGSTNYTILFLWRVQECLGSFLWRVSEKRLGFFCLFARYDDTIELLELIGDYVIVSFKFILLNGLGSVEIFRWERWLCWMKFVFKAVSTLILRTFKWIVNNGTKILRMIYFWRSYSLNAVNL